MASKGESTGVSKRIKDKIQVFKELNEIFHHNTKDSCWLLIDRKVYDVTHFDHPGKFQILL